MSVDHASVASFDQRVEDTAKNKQTKQAKNKKENVFREHYTKKAQQNKKI